MSYEYRVVWRRAKDQRRRTRIYQTLQGAEGFAGFLEDPPWDIAEGSIMADNIERLGEVDSVHIERRSVGEWETP